VGVTVRFLDRDGRPSADVTAATGARLLDVARQAGQPLEGTCNGQMACSTCHVILDPAASRHLPPAGPEEEDLLDLAPGATRGSRLACQVILPDDLAELRVRLPSR
jgi:ferredoxin